MKKLLIISLLLLTSCKAQEFYIGTAILYSITAGYTEGLQLMERNDVKDPAERKKINALWHKTQFAERTLGVSLGITIGEYSRFEWKKILLSVLLSAAIYWNIYDGTINLVRGNSFYHTSNTTASVMEQYAGLKIPVLAIAIGLNYLFNDAFFR